MSTNSREKKKKKKKKLVGSPGLRDRSHRQFRRSHKQHLRVSSEESTFFEKSPSTFQGAKGPKKGPKQLEANFWRLARSTVLNWENGPNHQDHSNHVLFFSAPSKVPAIGFYFKIATKSLKTSGDLAYLSYDSYRRPDDLSSVCRFPWGPKREKRLEAAKFQVGKVD